MSPLEQEQLLEQTRAQIRQHVAEIAELARTSRHGGEFFREFLNRVVASLQAQGGAIWVPTENGGCQLITENNFASCAFADNERQRHDINRVLVETQKNRRPFHCGRVDARRGAVRDGRRNRQRHAVPDVFRAGHPR